MSKQTRLIPVGVSALFISMYVTGAFLFVPLQTNAATPEETCSEIAKKDLNPDLIESTFFTTAAQCDLGQSQKTNHNLGATAGAPVGTVCCVKLKPPGISGPGQFQTVNDTPVAPQTGGSPTTLINPLGSGATLFTVAKRVVQTFLGLVGASALLVFVYAGIMWMTAGSSDRVKKAQETMKYAVIGVLMIMFAYGITSFVIDALTGGSSIAPKPAPVQYATPPPKNP
ncbi:MAG: pilin [bacterium]|nr:pilin [bacterium]